MARHTLFIICKKNDNTQLILQKTDNHFIQNKNRVWCTILHKRIVLLCNLFSSNLLFLLIICTLIQGEISMNLKLIPEH